jgi:uncharacterized protein YegP (UPF0339 family)
MKIHIEKNKKGRYFWRLVARNGRTLAHSEDYSSKRACEDTVKTVAAARAEPLPIVEREKP